MKLAQTSPAYHQGPVAQTVDEPITDINAAIDQLQVLLFVIKKRLFHLIPYLD